MICVLDFHYNQENYKFFGSWCDFSGMISNRCFIFVIVPYRAKISFFFDKKDQEKWLLLRYTCHDLYNLKWVFVFACFSMNRCREKQRKEASRLQTVNRKLSAMNKLLMEENDRLQKQVSHLVYENGYFRQHSQNVSFFFFGDCVLMNNVLNLFCVSCE